jgi:protein-L-isoaspartate(D-aspartate) O-methyltransferase
MSTAPADIAQIPQIQRRAMVDSQLRTNDVTQPRLVAAIAATPREPHLPAAHRAAAYIDRAVPLAGGRAINPPLTTARLIAQADVAPGAKVLLIGAATGYAAAILARLGAQVTAVEEDAALLATARQTLADAAGISFVEGPLAAGAPGGAPYDAMIVDGAVEMLPAALTAQLRDGARISCGVIDNGVARLARAVAVKGASDVRPLPFADLECVTLPGFAPPPSFTF